MPPIMRTIPYPSHALKWRLDRKIDAMLAAGSPSINSAKTRSRRTCSTPGRPVHALAPNFHYESIKRRERTHDIMALRISLALTLTVLLPSCGADKGGTSQTAATSDDTTGGSTTSQSTSTDEPTIAGTTDGSVTNGSSTDVTSSSPTTSDTGDTGGGIKEDCEAASVSEYQLEVLNCSCLVELGHRQIGVIAGPDWNSVKSAVIS